MTPQIAIIGAGPSGCYCAQFLLKARPNLQVDLFDMLPVPYGLARYGVATDHQGTKAVTRQFDRLFEKQGAKFIGNVQMGRDISVAQLRDHYDAVVLAMGMAQDRRLDLAGEHLGGVHHAGQMTRFLYDYPDCAPIPPLGRHVIIMGHGNVAIDLLRLLAKTPEELAGSDLGARAGQWLTDGQVETITIIGRSLIDNAKFDSAMIKELARLSAPSYHVIAPGIPQDEMGHKRLEALALLAPNPAGTKNVTFRFGLTPLLLQGDRGHITHACFRDDQGHDITLPCDSFISAIGFKSDDALRRQYCPEDAPASGRWDEGLYAAGWFHYGARGTIAHSRTMSRQLADDILANLPETGSKSGLKGLPLPAHHTNFAAWQQIDHYEQTHHLPNRCRTKLSTRRELLHHAFLQQE